MCTVNSDLTVYRIIVISNTGGSVISNIEDTEIAKRIYPKARFGAQPVIVAGLRSQRIAIAMRSSERISNDPDADSGSAELGRGDRGCRERWAGDGRPWETTDGGRGHADGDDDLRGWAHRTGGGPKSAKIPEIRRAEPF